MLIPRSMWWAGVSLLLAVQMPAATARESRVPQRLALLIGINDYSASRLAPVNVTVSPRGVQNLHGAVNDIESMREMLIARFAFDTKDVVLLPDQNATRKAILQRLGQLERQARKDDVILFYYSGHGSHVPNSRSREADKLDESIVPADTRAGAADIRDKELRRFFNRILDRGARLTVIFDSCYSGSGARGLPVEGFFRSVRPAVREALDGGDDGPRPEARGALVLSAAEDRQVAREIRDATGRSRGLFSWALLHAMRRSTPGERASETFLRAQAIVRAEAAGQDPVMAGSEEAKSSPLFQTIRGTASGVRVAVERVRPDGLVVIAGGWAHGLTVGSELRSSEDAAGARLEVTTLLGLGRALARIVLSPESAPVVVRPGTLLDLSGWASPPSRPLRIWIPRTALLPDLAALSAFARSAARVDVQWVTDPVETDPSHVIRWREGEWEMLDRDGAVMRVSGGSIAEHLAALPRGSAVFVQVPVPEWLARGIAAGDAAERRSVITVDRPEEADYVLVGRLHEGTVEYAWVRPFATRDKPDAVLPARTAWHSSTEGADVALRLQDAVMRLRRLLAWQTLESPPQSRAAYGIELRDQAGKPLVDGMLSGNHEYGLVLRSRPDVIARPRYVYAFVIDSHGRSVLLYPAPETGSVENRYPSSAHMTPPPEIRLDALFRVTEPYGVDTYFLLTSDEPLPDPEILEWDGVRGRPPATTAFEELLALTSSGERSADALRTGAHWSIDRVYFRSLPPEVKGQS